MTHSIFCICAKCEVTLLERQLQTEQCALNGTKTCHLTLPVCLLLCALKGIKPWAMSSSPVSWDKLDSAPPAQVSRLFFWACTNNQTVRNSRCILNMLQWPNTYLPRNAKCYSSKSLVLSGNATARQPADISVQSIYWSIYVSMLVRNFHLPDLEEKRLRQ